MKFSAVLVASLAATTQAFAPARSSVSKPLSAATLEAPATEAKEDAAPVAVEEVTSDMGVEKDWPVDGENFVKDSDRIMP